MGGSDFLPTGRRGAAHRVHAARAFPSSIHYPACKPTAARAPRDNKGGESSLSGGAKTPRPSVEAPAGGKHASKQHLNNHQLKFLTGGLAEGAREGGQYTYSGESNSGVCSSCTGRPGNIIISRDSVSVALFLLIDPFGELTGILWPPIDCVISSTAGSTHFMSS